MTGGLLLLAGLAWADEPDLDKPEAFVPEIAVLGLQDLRYDSPRRVRTLLNGGVQVRSSFLREYPGWFVTGGWRALAVEPDQGRYAVHDVRLGMGRRYPQQVDTDKPPLIVPYGIWAVGLQLRWLHVGRPLGGHPAAWASTGVGVALGGETVQVLLEAQGGFFTNFGSAYRPFDVGERRYSYDAGGAEIRSMVGLHVRPRRPGR